LWFWESRVRIPSFAPFIICFCICTRSGYAVEFFKVKISLKYREPIADVRRVVVKIGSRVLVQKNGRPDKQRMEQLVRQLAALRANGREVVVITSGAVSAGVAALGFARRPETLPELQMVAAVGQTKLMTNYDRMFGERGLKVGQVLLTHGDFFHKVRLTNARRTLESLLRHGVVPIVNENDVVADEEIRADLALGDNDYLAMLVVKLIRADLLVILSTVDGLRESSQNGRTKRVRYLESVTRKTFALVKGGASDFSKGGMESKLKAAKQAAATGCSVIIANGRDRDVLTRIMDCADVGTFIVGAGV
jgi:glutamate 5-kinase